MTCESGFYFLKESLERTLNGDWKGGPVWKPESAPTSISWKTGGHRHSETFAKVQAKHLESHVRSIVLNELDQIRRELHQLGIPTELPPMDFDTREKWALFAFG